MCHQYVCLSYAHGISHGSLITPVYISTYNNSHSLSGVVVCHASNMTYTMP